MLLQRLDKEGGLGAVAHPEFLGLSIFSTFCSSQVSENIKYIAVTSRALKLQVSKVWELRDLNPRLPHESLNKGKLTHAGGPGSNPGQAEV